MNPGFHPGLSYPDYNRIDAARSSVLKHFKKSPHHAYAAMTNPAADEPTLAKQLGEATHCAILEPDQLERRYVVWEGVKGPGRADRDRWAQFQIEHHAKIIVPQKEMDKALRIRDALGRKPWASELFGSAGVSELTAVWPDPEYELLCKVRADRLVIGCSTLLSLKTARDGSRERFQRAVAQYGYRVQAAMELDGFELLQPARRRLLWVVFETVPPYEIALYQPSEAALADGRSQYKLGLLQLKECRRTGVWPGYPNHPLELDLLPWEKPRAQSAEPPPKDEESDDWDDEDPL